MGLKSRKRLSLLLSKANFLSKSNGLKDVYAALDGDLCGDPPAVMFAAPVLPALPLEIWQHVLSFVTRLPGTLSTSLTDPFQMGRHVCVTPSQEKSSRWDVSALQLVCRAWRVAAIKLAYERLILCCSEHMAPILQILEKTKSRDAAGRGYGWWTREVECRFGTCKSDSTNDSEGAETRKAYNSDVAHLLRCTPNLVIYLNSNGWGCPLGVMTEPSVVETLAKTCGSSLQRLEWAASESPRWTDLQILLRHTPHLRSLYILFVAFPKKAETEETTDEKSPRCFLRYLRELQLGPFPTPHGAPIPYWETLLEYLMPPERFSADEFAFPIAPLEEELQLPALRSLSITPLNLLKPHTSSERFFSVYGSRIQFLRTQNLTPKEVFSVSESVAVLQNRSLKAMLSHCPNLRTLIFNPLQPTQLPGEHLCLERIGIFPPHENPINVPQRMIENLIQAPIDNTLDKIVTGDFPNLKVLRLRDVGSLAFLGRSEEWVENWATKLKERGIRFEDKDGMNFSIAIVECMEDMPDGV